MDDFEKLVAENQALIEENARIRHALEYYAQPRSYSENGEGRCTDIKDDDEYGRFANAEDQVIVWGSFAGKRAREALLAPSCICDE